MEAIIVRQILLLPVVQVIIIIIVLPVVPLIIIQLRMGIQQVLVVQGTTIKIINMVITPSQRQEILVVL
jgi:hypothetical protein